MVVGQFAEVDRRLGHRQIDRRHRRDVADEERRQALARDLVDGTERQPVAVGEGQVLVDPVAAGQRVGVQLARRQHDLAVLAVDPVAVVVDGDEVVVGADLLDLAEGVLQRLVIPERHVAQRHRVGVEVAAGQRRVAGQLALLHPLEREGVAGRGDVVGDVGRFARLLVRRHDEALQGGGIDGAADRHEEAQAEGRHERPQPHLRHLIRGQADADHGRRHQRVGGGHASVDVDVGGAGDQARRHRQHLGNRQPRAGSDRHQPAGRQRGQVRRRRRTQLQAALHAHAQEPGAEVDQADADGRQSEQQPDQRMEAAPERQPEQIEADVVAEHRIGLAERHRVPEHEPRLPPRRSDRGDQHRGAGRDQHGDRPQPGRVDHDDTRTFRRHHHDLPPREDAKGQPQVQGQDAEGQHRRRHPDRRLRSEAAGIHRLEAHLAEPQPVRVEVHDGWHQEQRRDEEDEQRNTA